MLKWVAIHGVSTPQLYVMLLLKVLDVQLAAALRRTNMLFVISKDLQSPPKTATALDDGP
jgi:hypothetical protein